MNLRSYRAFATELQKIAVGLTDAGVRQLLADRKGEEYLPGGELPTNTSVPAERTIPAGVPIAKIAASMMLAPHSYDLRAKKKGPTKYQKARDYTIAGVKGALTGGAVLALTHNMKSGTNVGRELAAHSIRRAAGLGAGASIADRAIRHDEFKKTALVGTAPGAAFRSPADALDKANNVGKFENKVHNSTTKPSGLIGNKFRIV